MNVFAKMTGPSLAVEDKVDGSTHSMYVFAKVTGPSMTVAGT